jgi:hypothetical protein
MGKKETLIEGQSLEHLFLNFFFEGGSLSMTSWWHFFRAKTISTVCNSDQARSQQKNYERTSAILLNCSFKTGKSFIAISQTIW